MKENFHTHTCRCKHAEGTELDYVNAALKNGLDIIGFSDHGPYPDFDPGYRMDYSELDAYVDTLNSLKHDFSDSIKIYTGLEIEYDPHYSSYYEDLIDQRGIDYLILGQHFFKEANGSYVNIFSAGDTSRFIRYAEDIIKGMKTGYFMYAAHPDLIFYNDFAYDENCQRAVDILLDGAATNDFIYEVNANGRRRGIKEFVDGARYPYPLENFWTQASKARVRTVIGADCHSPSFIWDDAVEWSYNFAEQLKLNLTVCRPA